MRTTQEDIFDILRQVTSSPVYVTKAEFSIEEDSQKEHSTTREDSGAPWILGAPWPCRGGNRLARPTKLLKPHKNLVLSYIYVSFLSTSMVGQLPPRPRVS